MGSVRTYPSPAVATERRPLAAVRRAVDLVIGGVLLLLALPLMAVLALAVRLGSHGPILHRERASDARGRAVELLSFRTSLDGAGTAHHERLRAIVGADAAAVLTPAGRVLRVTRMEHLPRLINVVRGDASLL